jgi:hypothetical protein
LPREFFKNIALIINGLCKHSEAAIMPSVAKQAKWQFFLPFCYLGMKIARLA